MNKNIIDNAILYVKNFFANESTGHDYYHTMRVFNNATQIAIKEGADLEIVQQIGICYYENYCFSPTNSKWLLIPIISGFSQI